MKSPKLEINLDNIEFNVKTILHRVSQSGIELVGVTKGVLACPEIVNAYITGGVTHLADARLSNIGKIRSQGFQGQVTLLRSPMSHELERTVTLADISVQTEISKLEAINQEAKVQGKQHGFLVMVDVGDRREGVLPEHVKQFVSQAVKLDHIKFMGLGFNVGCFGGVLPTWENAEILVDLQQELLESGINTPILSGGSTCGLTLLDSPGLPQEINQLRIGEGILVGYDTTGDVSVSGTTQDTVRLIAEVIEIKQRPTLPKGVIGKDAFGNTPTFQDKGMRTRAILAVGKQDIQIDCLTPVDSEVSIEGASSDHLIIDITGSSYNYKIGDKVTFSVKYGGILSGMTSPYINQEFV